MKNNEYYQVIFVLDGGVTETSLKFFNATQAELAAYDAVVKGETPDGAHPRAAFVITYDSVKKRATGGTVPFMAVETDEKVIAVKLDLLAGKYIELDPMLGWKPSVDKETT